MSAGASALLLWAHLYVDYSGSAALSVNNVGTGTACAVTQLLGSVMAQSTRRRHHYPGKLLLMSA